MQIHVRTFSNMHVERGFALTLFRQVIVDGTECKSWLARIITSYEGFLVGVKCDNYL